MGTFGFEIANSAGEILLDSTDTTMRVVHTMYLPYNTTTTETVSNFDINNGTFYFRAHLAARGNYSFREPAPHFQRYDSIDDRDFAFGRRVFGYYAYPGMNNVPTMNWNNSTKVMTATTPESVDAPTGSPYTPAVDAVQGQIIFLEYI